jgi:hypothetical protein
MASSSPKERCGSSAGPEGGLLAAEGLQSFKEVALGQKLEHGGRLAARQNQPIQAGEFLRFAHLCRLGPGSCQGFSVSAIIALNCQYADARPRAFCRQPCSPLTV